MKTKILFLIVVCLSALVSAQSLEWITNSSFEQLGPNELVNEIENNLQSYAVSAEQLIGDGTSGYLEANSFSVNSQGISEDTFMGNLTLGLTPTDHPNEGYKIRLMRSTGGLIDPDGNPFEFTRVDVFDASGNSIGGQTIDDISQATALRIEKTAVGVLEFIYNGTVIATVSDALGTYRASISTTVTDLKLAYGVSNFVITESSYPLPNVTDTNRNWTSVKTFDTRGDLTSASVGYFDALSRGIQTQTKDILTGKNWATQTLYDSQGRPAVSTLSAPVNSNLNFTYESDFIKNSSGTTFGTSDFEDTPELPSTVSDEAGTLGHYYSTQNTEEPYQDVTDRPYSRTIYDDLNPGTIRAVVGGNSANVAGESGLQYDFPQGYSHTMPATQEVYYAFGLNEFPENREGWFAAHGIDPLSVSGRMLTHRATKSVNIDVHGNETVVITDLEGRTLAAARTNHPDPAQYKEYDVVSVIGPQGYIDVHLPQGTTNGDIGFLGGTSGYTVWDLRTGNQVTNLSTMTGGHIYRIQHSLDLGIDKTILTMNTSGEIDTRLGAKGLEYKINYYDFALNYYDDAGHLVESIQPLGFDDINLSSSNANGIPSHSMSSNYIYNSLGQLLYTSSPDEGAANFTYRKDGQIRFSQNSKQQEEGTFSYTNYDVYGRPKESGVCADEYPGIITGEVPLTLESVYPSVLAVDGNSMYKTANGWSSGSFQSQEAYTGDFKISWKVSSASQSYKNTMVGFSIDPLNNGYTSINYAMYCYSGYLRPYKDGNNQTGIIGNFGDNDVMSLAREGNRINYYKNDEIIYDLVIDPEHMTAPMYIDGSIFRINTLVSDIEVEQISGATTYTNPGDTFEVDPAFCTERTFTLYDIPDQSGLDIALNQNASSYPYRKQQWLAGNVSKTWTASPETSTTWYSYDVYGRVTWMVQFINGLGAKTIDYTYDDVTGEVVKLRYSGDQAEQFTHKYTYNQVGQLVKVETSYDGINFKEQASYTYYETGALKRVNLSDGLQGIDYVYNISGALKSINHPSLSPTEDPGGDADDVFGLIIDYHKRDYLRLTNDGYTSNSGTDLYDGNIKATRWAISDGSSGAPVTQNAYTYQYDHNRWLEQANFGEANASGTIIPNINGDYRVSNLSYDPNGNLLSLSRNKNSFNSSNAMDNFAYSYTPGTNQLDYVADTATASEDAGDLLNQSPGNYTYNSIGQLVVNNQDGIQYQYTASGLVSNISNISGPSESLTFSYNDRGHRVKKRKIGANGTLSVTETYYVRDASGQPIAIYDGSAAQNVEYPIYGASRLGLSRDGVDRYELTDHLGNVRAVVKEVSFGNPTNPIVFSDDFEDSVIAPWQAGTSTPEMTSGFMKVRLQKNTAAYSTYAAIQTDLIAGHQYRVTYKVKDLTPSESLITGIATASNQDTQESGAIQVGVYTHIYTASYSAPYKFHVRSVGSLGSDYYAYIDNVVIEDISPGENTLLQAYTDYYPFGMPMPNRNLEGDYRYKYQGQEKDPETGKEAFELRLWDSRIGRWLTTDPYRQFHSPYLGMGNNPVSVIDPDGGFACIDAEGNPFPCPEGYERYNDEFSMFYENNKDAFFGADGKFQSDAFKLPPTVIGDGVFSPNSGSASSIIPLAFRGGQEINIGRLKKSGQFRIYNPANDFRGNQHTDVFRLSKYARGAGIVYTVYQLGGDALDVANAETPEAKTSASQEFGINLGVSIGSYLYPPIGLTYMAGDIISNTETYQIELHRAKERKRANDGIWEGNLGGDNATVRPNWNPF